LFVNKKRMIILVVVMMSFFCVGAFATEDKVIRVATPGSYAPFTMYDAATKEWSGFEIELWRSIGKRFGYNVEFLRFDIPATFAEVDLGRADTVAKQVSITPARQQKYNFSQPFFFSPYFLTVAESNEEIKSWKDMDGKTIALAEGSAMNEYIAALDPENKVKKFVYESDKNMFAEVSVGRIDACPSAFIELPNEMKRNPALKLKFVDLAHPIYVEVNAYPFARTERGQTILRLTNEALSQMIADGSYSKLCKKWFDIDVMETQPAKDYQAAHSK
jgi:putative amino-acid transport system substrate-binding protein